MKILHLSDFHYKSSRKSKLEQDTIINKLINEIGNAKIDLIIFSGDLVNDGSNYSHFTEAKRDFLDVLSNKLSLSYDKILLCAGNHDIDRSNRSEAVITLMDSLSSNEELNAFVGKKDFEYSCLPFGNYKKFTDELYDISISSEALYSTHKLEINNTRFGILCINNSWRAVGLNDDNNLIYPTDKLKEGIDYINKDVDIKILISHHPLSDFKKYNSYELEDIFYNHFDIMFSGHTHKKNVSVNYNANEGTIQIVAPAALSAEKDTELGFGILDIDFEENEFEFSTHLYDKKNNIFYTLPSVRHDIPSTAEKSEQTKLRKKLRKKLETELKAANQLFVSKDHPSESSFFEMATVPVLKSKSSSELTDEDNLILDFEWDQLLDPEDDYLILGKGKCGKTILLKKIQLELLRDYSVRKIIPVYIDLKEWSATSRQFDLLHEMCIYFERNKADMEKLLKEEKILILLDNYHEHSIIINNLADYVNNSFNIRIIACTDENVLSSIEDTHIDGRTLSKLYFHRLRKKHIKQLTESVYKLPKDKQDEIVEKINSIFTKLYIPFNFWTVSLFLWVFKKDLNSNFQNDVELINLYIEKLLEKDELTINRSNFGYDKYKKYLSYLAHHLLVKYHDNTYSISYLELISFTEEYLGNNSRYTIESREVIEYIELKGLLRKTFDGRYTFRLNGVFEYFIANYMTIDQDFLYEIIDDDCLYFSFSNEFELYAGFKRDDEKFLDKIYDKTCTIFEETNEAYNSSNVSKDKLLVSKLLELNEMKPLVEKISEKLSDGLSSTEQDSLEEQSQNRLGLNDDTQSEVHKKESHVIDNSILSLEKTLFILGKVFKNVDEIPSNRKVIEIFDYIVNSACNWGFKIIDDLTCKEINELIKTDNDDEAKKLLQIITNFIPTLVQVRINDMIGDKNLQKIINQKIDEALKDKNNNQYKLFILYFLLVDINLQQNKHRLDEIIDAITIPILKYSILLKLNYYLAFKVNSDDKDSIAFLKSKIQKQQLRFRSDTDLGSLHKSFSDKDKIKGVKNLN